MEDTINTNETSEVEGSKFANAFSFILVSSVYLIILSVVPGLSDLLLLFFFSTTVLTIFYQVYRIRSGFRSVSKGVFSENSLAYKFLNGKSIWQVLISVLIACLSSLAFLLTLKLIILSHGYPVGLLIILLPLVLLTILDGRDYSLSIDNMMKHDDAKDVVNFVVNIGIKTIMVAILTAVLLSAFDTYDFYKVDAASLNMATHAQEHAIPLGEGGQVARALINFFVIIDSAIFTGINEIFTSNEIEKGLGVMTLYFLVTLVMSIMKMIAFSIAYIFINISLKGRVASSLVRKISKTRRKFNEIKKEDGYLKNSKQSDT